ncbi:hypothetical protein ACG3SL_09925 [Sphingomonas sp. CJ20]
MPGATGTALAQQADVVARIGDDVITRADVTRQLADGGIDPRAATARQFEGAARAAAAERVVERSFDANDGALPEDLSQALAQARRRVMLEYYVRQRLDAYRPTDREIARFVESNPRMFAGRETFRYQNLLIQWKTPAARTAAIALLDAFARIPAPDVAAVNQLKASLVAAGADFRGGSFVRSTEQFEGDVLQRLQPLGRGHATTYAVQGQGIDLLVLLDRIPDPADPGVMQAQIAALLSRQHAERQREELITRLSEPVLADGALRPRRTGAVAETAADDRDEAKSRLGMAVRSMMPAWLVGSGGKFALVLILAAIIAPCAMIARLAREGRSYGWRWHRIAWPVLHALVTPFGLWAISASARSIEPMVLAGLSIGGLALGGLVAWMLRGSPEDPLRAGATAGPFLIAAGIQLVLGGVILFA